MAKFIAEGDTIEGDSISIQVRKWIPTTIVYLASVKKNMYRYATSLNSSAVVKKSHIVEDDKDIKSATKDYHREIGDELDCFAMKVYIDSKKRIRIVTKEGITHTHGANLTTTDKHTIATISRPLTCLLKVIADKEQKSNQQSLENNI